MVSPAVLTAEQVAGVAARLLRLPTAWSEENDDRVTAALGWPVAERVGGALLLDAGLPTRQGRVLLQRGDLGYVEVNVADAWLDDSPQAQAFRRDAFLTARDAVSTVAGPPVRRPPGLLPQARWHAPAGFLQLVDNLASVTLSVISPADAKLQDEEEAAAGPEDEVTGW